MYSRSFTEGGETQRLAEMNRLATQWLDNSRRIV